jgi:HAMP domain-containing protein
MKAKSHGSRVRKADGIKSGNGQGNGDGHKTIAPPPPLNLSEKRMPKPELTSDMLGGLLTSEAKYKKDLLAALTALRKGDFSIRLPVDWPGLEGKIADTFNDVIEITDRLATEVERLSRVVGKEGKISQRVSVGEVSGSWATKVAAINGLISDLVHPISETARVLGAVAKGDLSQTMALEIEGRPLEGEFLRTAKTVNTMVDQLSSFASEVTRVAREVGTEGKLGGHAKVKGVAGTWKDLTDSVNSMAGNLTAQVRNIAAVTKAVANGDLSN